MPTPIDKSAFFERKSTFVFLLYLLLDLRVLRNVLFVQKICCGIFFVRFVY